MKVYFLMIFIFGVPTKTGAYRYKQACEAASKKYKYSYCQEVNREVEEKEDYARNSIRRTLQDEDSAGEKAR